LLENLGQVADLDDGRGSHGKAQVGGGEWRLSKRGWRAAK